MIRVKYVVVLFQVSISGFLSLEYEEYSINLGQKHQNNGRTRPKDKLW